MALVTTEITLPSTRTYLLDKSDTLPAGSPALVYLHGLYGNAAIGKNLLQIDSLVEPGQFMVAYPNGTMVAANPLSRSWNAGNCCSTAFTTNVNDVGFLDSVINDLISNRGADMNRIYVGGHSNGALMAFRYICERPWRVAGLMTVGGVKTHTGYSSPAINRPWLHIHGAQDANMPVLGGLEIEPGFMSPSLISTITDLTGRGMSLELIMPAEAGHSMESLNTNLFPASVAALFAERIL